MQKITAELKPRELRTISPPLDQSKTEEIKVQEKKVTVSGRAIPNIWLRDNCQCSSSMHPSTKQRLLDTFSIPEDLSIEKHVISKEQGVKISWSDGHESEYTQHFLSQAIKPFESRAVVRRGLTATTLWDSSIASDPPSVSFSDDSPSATATLLQRIVSHPCNRATTAGTNPAAAPVRLLLH
jgi:trimethyllysine dioxygenase